MRLLLKILLLIFAMITTVREAKSSTAVNVEPQFFFQQWSMSTHWAALQSFGRAPSMQRHLDRSPVVGYDRTNAFISTAALAVTPAAEATAAKSVAEFAAREGAQSLLQANKAAGNLFRDELATALRGEGRTVYTEAFKRTPFGKRYIDLDVWQNGVNLGGIETKVGRSRYLPLQRLKDAWLDANGYPVQLVRKPLYW